MSKTPEPLQHQPSGKQKPTTTRIVAGEKPKRRRHLIEAAAVVGVVALIGAGALVASTHKPSTTAQASVPTAASALRLGYFGNVTHAPALVGLHEGFFQKDLGSTKLSTQVFNAGPSAIEALNAGAIDAAYVGPSPAINAFVQSSGSSIRIIAGAASGGAELVVQPSITKAAQLKGQVLADPQLGGTQDVSLRTWLTNQGLKTTADGGGDVSVNPTDNATTLKLFQEGKIAGAWLPEPWASRLVLQAGGHVLVNEASLWAKGQFSTTVLIVNTKYLQEHPTAVTELLEGHVQAVDWLNKNPASAAAVINKGLTAAAGAPLKQNVIDRSLTQLKFTTDPLAGTYPELLAHGVAAGVTKQANISGIFDLAPLNAVLKSGGQQPVSAGGLGTE